MYIIASKQEKSSSTIACKDAKNNIQCKILYSWENLNLNFVVFMAPASSQNEGIHATYDFMSDLPKFKHW